MRKSKKYEGSKIICEYDSSNIKFANYDTNTKKLIITFSNSTEYEYLNVPHETFTIFDTADSQGKIFNKQIKNNFTFEKNK